MITKLNKNSELIKRCQQSTSCEECDAKNEFDCVGNLIYTYLMYCADALDELHQEELNNKNNNENEKE